jgi:hypothetical protein
MKGTLISSDYVKARDNSIRLIETNTDTVIYDDILDNEFNWQPLVDIISGSYTNLTLVYKPELHLESISNLVDKMTVQLPDVSISQSMVNLNDIYPDVIDDSSERFILRLAYNENAIIDSTYCADSFAPLKLMHDAGHSGSIVPFYAVSGSTTYDTINTAAYSENVPNAVFKNKVWPNDVSFKKITDWSSAKSGLTGSAYLSSYEISDESISDNVAWSYRNYSIAYGTNLDIIDLGTTIAYAKLTLPTTSQVNITAMSSNTDLSVKHYYEFSTSLIKSVKRREGLYSTEHFISASGEDLAFEDVAIGKVLQSFHVEGMPDTDDATVYSSYEITGSQWPAGSKITGSSVVSNLDSYPASEGIIYGLKMSGVDEKFYLGPTTSVLSYDSGSDKIKFRAISEIEEDDIYLIDINNNIVDIEENKMIVLNTPTGSFNSVNLEPTDNIVTGNTPFFFAFHNNKGKCFMPGSKVTMADNSLKEIQDIKVGDIVLTKDGTNCVVEDTYIYSINQMTKMYTNGNITVTNSHPLFINGEWSNAEQLGWESKIMYVKNLYNLKTKDNFILEGIPASGTTHNELNVVKDNDGFTKILGNKQKLNVNLI